MLATDASLSEVTINLTQVIAAALTLTGGVIAGRLSKRTTQETTAGTILNTVWQKLEALEARVSTLEGKVTRRDILLSLSRSQIISLEESWPKDYVEEIPDRHPALRPFLETGLIDPDGSRTHL